MRYSQRLEQAVTLGGEVHFYDSTVLGVRRPMDQIGDFTAINDSDDALMAELKPFG